MKYFLIVISLISLNCPLVLSRSFMAKLLSLREQKKSFMNYDTNYHSKPNLIIEKDIAIKTSKQSSLRNFNVETDKAKRWKDGLVPFVIDEADFTEDDKNLIRASLKTIGDQTKGCIRFFEYTASQAATNSLKSWITFVQENSCWSWVGKHEGEQWISIGPSCLTKGSVIHEVMHSLGFWHEQSRPDRDNYIEVLYDNIQNGFKSEFQIRKDEIETRNMPYDYYSVMHYPIDAFSADQVSPTIRVKQSNVNQRLIGHRNDLSQIDVEKIINYYQCFKRDEFI